jgi:hypothetical protein
MNNNGFAIMRYLRDLGADAELLLYANDGVGCLSHFRPESDTWNLSKWSPYIRQTGIYNWTTSMIPDVRQRTWPPLRRFLRRQLTGYDKFIGSGIAPAVFNRIGFRLSIFFPYCLGIEWFDDPDFRKWRRRALLSRPFLEHLRASQLKGIMAAQHA